MKEHPIIFTGEMVRAILDGRKTHTRRVIRPQPACEWSPIVGHYCPAKIDRHGEEYPGDEVFGAADESEGRKSPYGQPGDTLWVRETFKKVNWAPYSGSRTVDSGVKVEYLADGERLWVPYSNKLKPRASEIEYPDTRWRPSIHMPRWAARILLDVVDIGVERVQDITEEDVIAEGVIDDDWLTWREEIGNVAAGVPHSIETPIDVFRALWDKINAKRGFGWDVNPWVWRVEFKRRLNRQ